MFVFDGDPLRIYGNHNNVMCMRQEVLVARGSTRNCILRYSPARLQATYKPCSRVSNGSFLRTTDPCKIFQDPELKGSPFFMLDLPGILSNSGCMYRFRPITSTSTFNHE